MKRTKKRSALPRVTVLAYSRRDLLAFAESVEALRHQVEDLRLVVADLKEQSAAGRRRRQQPAAAVNGTAAGEGGAR